MSWNAWMRRAAGGVAVFGCLVSSNGCGSSGTDATGSAEVFAVTSSALSQADITRVALTVSGAGIAPAMTAELAHVGTKWQGILGGIPAGDARVFHGDAFDATSTLLYSGERDGVTIAKGQKAVVGLILQQAQAADPFSNSAPRIDSMYASSDSVEPGGTLAIAATYSDPDVADTLTPSWSSSPSGGSFADAAAGSTTWTAPAMPGPYTLRFSVHDDHGASAAISFVVDVAATPGAGSASVAASFNDAPTVQTMTSSANPIAAGAPTQLGLTASDLDLDAVTAWEWTSTCAGTFDDAHAAAPSFTLSDATATSCAFAVKITDARGGWSTGTLGVAAGTAAPVDLAPVVETTFQSTDVADAGTEVSFRVKGHDPAGGQVTYAWTASAGVAGVTSTNANGESTFRWTAPACFDTAAVVSVTLTTSANVSTTQAFTVAAGAAGTCALRPIQRASVTNSGVQAPMGGWLDSLRGGLSADGRFAVFMSTDVTLTADTVAPAPDPVPPARAAFVHVYVRDLVEGTTKLVDRSEAAGAAANGEALAPTISADGRYVAFYTSATDLLAGGSSRGVYVRDMAAPTPAFVRANVPSAGGVGSDGYAWQPMISSDGTHVCFSTYETLDPSDSNPIGPDVYVRDLVAQTTRRVSSGSTGDADFCSLSADGELVAFATNVDFAVEDTNGAWDIYARNMRTSALSLVSEGTGAGPLVTTAGVLSDGQSVAFVTATPIVPGDTTNGSIYVRDLASGVLRHLTEGIADVSSFSFAASGGRVAFYGTAFPGVWGTYTLDLTTGAVVLQSVAESGALPNSPAVYPRLAADGRYVMFTSNATNLVSGDSNDRLDVFVAPVQ